MSRRARSPLVAVLAVAALLAVPLTTAALLGPAPSTLVVGYASGQKAAAVTLLSDVGVRVTWSLDDLDALVVTSPLDLPRLATLVGPIISFVEPEFQANIQGAQWNGAQWDAAQWDGAQWDGAQWDAGSRDAQWGLAAVRAPDAWAIEPGRQAASLCIVDSGVDAHDRDLAPNVALVGYNAINDTTFADDDAGHGTHVAGIAAAARGDGWGVLGVTNSTILPVKVLSADGKGRTSDVANGMAWCATHGADVVLLALSVDGQSRIVERAIDLLDSRNVVIVASAGNAGPCSDCVAQPARDPRVIAVAASDPTGALASFSSTGPEVALLAPGVHILSDLPGNAFAYGSGTSQAAAFAAGTAALLREHHPCLSPQEVRWALVAGAANGVLDAAGALRASRG